MLTAQQVALLLDLVDNKLTCMTVFDSDDRKIQALLVGAKKGLEQMVALPARKMGAAAAA